MLPPPVLLFVVLVIAAAGVTLLLMLRRGRATNGRKPDSLGWSSPLDFDEPEFGDASIDQMLEFLPDFENGVPPGFAVAVFTSGFALLDGFNWATWKDGEGRPYIDDPSRVDGADLITLRKLLTFLWRQDHFSEGFLHDAAAAGVPQRALRRLAALRLGR